MTFLSICPIFCTDSFLSSLVFYLFLSRLFVFDFASTIFSFYSALSSHVCLFLYVWIRLSVCRSVFTSLAPVYPVWSGFPRSSFHACITRGSFQSFPVFSRSVFCFLWHSLSHHSGLVARIIAFTLTRLSFVGSALPLPPPRPLSYYVTAFTIIISFTPCPFLHFTTIRLFTFYSLTSYSCSLSPFLS